MGSAPSPPALPPPPAFAAAGRDAGFFSSFRLSPLPYGMPHRQQHGAEPASLPGHRQRFCPPLMPDQSERPHALATALAHRVRSSRWSSRWWWSSSNGQDAERPASTSSKQFQELFERRRSSTADADAMARQDPISLAPPTSCISQFSALWTQGGSAHGLHLDSTGGLLRSFDSLPGEAHSSPLSCPGR